MKIKLNNNLILEKLKKSPTMNFISNFNNNNNNKSEKSFSLTIHEQSNNTGVLLNSTIFMLQYYKTYKVNSDEESQQIINFWVDAIKHYLNNPSERQYFTDFAFNVRALTPSEENSIILKARRFGYSTSGSFPNEIVEYQNGYQYSVSSSPLPLLNDYIENFSDIQSHEIQILNIIYGGDFSWLLQKI